MSIIEYSLIIDDENWEQELKSHQEIADTIFNTTMEHLVTEFDLELFEFEKNFNCNLILTNDDQVQELNNQFRGQDKPTNVLSFANIDSQDFEDILNDEDDVSLGEIFVALETLQKEATEKSISLEHHFAHLFIHGILHLLGFDHQIDEDAEEMEQIEVEILQKLNIINPYEE